MDGGLFESRVIELMFKSNARMIPQLVAYRVGCAVDTARGFLDDMVSRNILTMEVDDKGVIYYDMLGRPPAIDEPLSWSTSPPRALVPAGGGAPLATQGGQFQQLAYVHPQAPMPLQIQINNAPAPPPPPAYVMVGPREKKSAVLAFFLGFLFGPLGMLYSTGSGAVIMFLVSLVAIPASGGAALLLVPPVSGIWAASAASNRNAGV